MTYEELNDWYKERLLAPPFSMKDKKIANKKLSAKKNKKRLQQIKKNFDYGKYSHYKNPKAILQIHHLTFLQNQLRVLCINL